MIAVLRFITLGTVENMAAERLGSTMLNGPHCRSMTGWHSLTVLLPIRWSVATEDSGQFYHGRLFINLSMVAAVISLLLFVRWV
jgi:hypothetical protein